MNHNEWRDAQPDKYSSGADSVFANDVNVSITGGEREVCVARI